MTPSISQFISTAQLRVVSITRSALLHSCSTMLRAALSCAVAFSLTSNQPLNAAAPATATPAVEINMGTIHGKMKFDKDTLTVAPGAKVSLLFRNTDEMQHNWLLCRPGKNMALTIAQKAWTMGPQAVEKQFAPNDTNVLFHTRVLNPQESETIQFTAPLEPGDYPYVCTLPGHAFSMRGIMKVASNEAQPTLRDVVYLYYEIPKSMQMPDFDLLKPIRIKPIPSNTLDLSAVKARSENFAVQFLGELEVTQDGNYDFFTSSDDGTKLFLNDQLVVNNDGHHGMTDKEGSLALKKGVHQLRLQYFQADGGAGMRVSWKGPGFSRRFLSPAPTKEREIDKEKYFLQVQDKPIVVRTFIDGGPSRSIAVGLPGGLNYCFNAETCEVAFAWTGMFLDVGPDRGYGVDRGGGWSKILGERFEVGAGAGGLQLSAASDKNKTAPRFLGYRRTGNPEFLFELQGTRVSQTIEPLPSGSTSTTGLVYHFKTQGQSQDLRFHIRRNPSELEISSSAGQWDGDSLLIPAAQIKDFTVSLRRVNSKTHSH